MGCWTVELTSSRCRSKSRLRSRLSTGLVSVSEILRLMARSRCSVLVGLKLRIVPSVSVLFVLVASWSMLALTLDLLLGLAFCIASLSRSRCCRFRVAAVTPFAAAWAARSSSGDFSFVSPFLLPTALANWLLRKINFGFC